MLKSNNQKANGYLIPLFFLTGFIYTFATKLQSSQIVVEANITKNFFHPYIQVAVFFLGEACCLFFYFSSISNEKDQKKQAGNLMQRLVDSQTIKQENEQGEKDEVIGQQMGLQGKQTCKERSIFERLKRPQKKYKPWIFVIPAFMDVGSCILQTSALAFISSSTYMMLKGASIITTLYFSRRLISMQVQSRHLAGCGLSIMGLILVGIAEVYVPPSEVHSDIADKQTSELQINNIIGYTLMVISLIFNGYLYAYEEKLFRQYPSIKPTQMVGYEGVFGFCICFGLIILLSFIPCSNIKYCVFDNNDDFKNSQTQKIGTMENFSSYFTEIIDNFFLFFLILASGVSIPIYNYYGVTITKVYDGLTRSLLNVCRTALLWLFGLFITACVSEDSNYRIEQLGFRVNFVKFLGFVCIINGTLIYNKVILGEFLQDRQDSLPRNTICSLHGQLDMTLFSIDEEKARISSRIVSNDKK